MGMIEPFENWSYPSGFKLQQCNTVEQHRAEVKRMWKALTGLDAFMEPLRFHHVTYAPNNTPIILVVPWKCSANFAINVLDRKNILENFPQNTLILFSRLGGARLDLYRVIPAPELPEGEYRPYASQATEFRVIKRETIGKMRRDLEEMFIQLVSSTVKQ